MTAPAPDDPQQSHAPAQQQQKHELAPAAAAAPSAAPMTQAAALSAEEARRARRRVSAEARKRIANACTACKTRKQKCSGERPQCNICRRRHAECVYIEQTPRPVKRQRRDTSSALSPPDDSSLWGHALEVENETRGKGSGGGSGGGAATARAGGARAPSTIPPSTPPRPIGRRDSSVTASSAYGDHPTGSAHNGHGADGDDENVDGSEEDDLKVEAPVDHKTRMLSDPHGRLLYIGETGSLSFLARIRKVVKETLGPSAFTLDSGQYSFADRPLIPGPDRIEDVHAPTSLPNRQDIPKLLDLFFEHCNDIYYVLDREEADSIAERVAEGPGVMPATGSSTRDVALLNAMCALGCFYTDRPLATAAEGMRYFSIARALMEDVFECADFWSVRLILLLALYLHFAAKRNATFIYIGLAVRIAQSLGLHHCTRSDPLYDDDTWRRRRMVFWTLYTLDRFTSYSLGRPFTINDDTCTDPVFKLGPPPAGDKLLAVPCHPSQPAHVHHIHRSAAKVRLSVIIGHIAHRVYLHRSITRVIAEDLTNELKSWWDSMPPCTSLNEGVINPVVELHLAYLHAVTLLTRPFLQRVVEEYTVDHVRNAHTKKCSCSGKRTNIKRKIHRYAGACVLVAERTVSLAHRMLKQNNLPRNDSGFVYHLFTAGLVLFFASLPQLIRPNDSPPEAPTKSQPLLVSLLADCAVTDPITAKRYHNIMSRFLTAINDYRSRPPTRKPSPPPPPPQQRTAPAPDLLDELQATSTSYFSGAPPTREQSSGLTGMSRGASPSAQAAHALVQLPSGHNHLPPGTLPTTTAATITSPIPTTLPQHPADLSQNPVGPFFMQHSTVPTTMTDDNGYFLSDFSSFLGWQEQLAGSGLGSSGGSGGMGSAMSVWSGPEEESPSTGGVWELSWEPDMGGDLFAMPTANGEVAMVSMDVGGGDVGAPTTGMGMGLGM